MRGKQLRDIRLANLRLLRESFTLEQIAERSGTDAVYLSQISNQVIQKGARNPRSISDGYAAKIEKGFGLPTGWMDEPHDEPTDATEKIGDATPDYAPPVRVALSLDELEWLRFGRSMSRTQREALKVAIGESRK